MQIVSLRILWGTENQSKEYRFQSGVHPFKTSYLFKTTQDEAAQVIQAFNYCLKRNYYAPLKEAMLTLIDDAGTEWSIRRASGVMQIFRERTLLDENQANQSLIMALLDLDLSMDFSNHSGRSFSSYQIECYDDEIISRPMDEHGKIDSNERNFPYILASYGKELAKFDGLQRKSILDVLPKLKALSEAFIDVQKVIELEKRFSSLIAVNPAQSLAAGKILTEIGLITHIEQSLKIIEEKKDYLKSLKNKSKALEEELSDFGPHMLKLLDNEIPWFSLLNQFAELASQRSLVDVFSSFGQTFTQHINQLISELKNQSDGILQTLSQSEKLLSEELGDLEDYREWKNKILGEIERESKAEEEQPAIKKALTAVKSLSPYGGRNRLYQKRITTEDDLLRLNDFRDRIHKTAQMVSNFQMFLREHAHQPGEALKKYYRFEHEELQKLETMTHDWQLLIANHFGDQEPSEAFFHQLLGSLHALIKITALKCENEKIHLELEDFNRHVNLLFKAVKDWRAHTYSMRKDTISELSSLITEAKNIIRFKHEKENLLDKLNELSALEKVPELAQHNFVTLKNETLKKWESAIKSLGLSPYSPFSPEADQLANIANEIAMVPSLCQRLGINADHLFQPFGIKESDSPILVLANFSGVENHATFTRIREQLLGANALDRCVILLSNRDDLVSQFEQMGSGTVSLASSSGATRTKMPQPSPPSRVNKAQILTAKAEEALRILKTTKVPNL